MGSMSNDYDKLSVIFDKLLGQNHNLPHQNSLRDVESSSSYFVSTPKSMNIQDLCLAYHERFCI